MLRFSRIFLFIFIAASLFSKTPVKIKNLISIEGLRENQIMGYGLVAGLDGRGDSKSFNLTKKMLLNLTANSGFDVSEDDLKSKNVAAVLITAKIGPFSRPGDLIDISVSSIGDAKSLEGGVLLQAPLKGADGATYAAAAGKIIAGSKTQNASATGSIPNGGIIEKELLSDFITANKLRLILKYPDFMTADQIAAAISKSSPGTQAKAVDSSLIEVSLGEEEVKNPVAFIAKFETLAVTPDFAASLVIDKKSGIIVIGEEIIIQNCMVATPSAQLTVGGGQQQKGKNFEIKSQTVGELVKILNDVGLNSNEIISIVESLSKIGALNAKIIIL
jgi:flagellar P-ring protein FlgI